jgi:hypothetical protein
MEKKCQRRWISPERVGAKRKSFTLSFSFDYRINSVGNLFEKKMDDYITQKIMVGFLCGCGALFIGNASPTSYSITVKVAPFHLHLKCL